MGLPTAGPASFSYDLNANLIYDGSTSFLYDVENRMVGAGGLKNAALRYDPLGRLYEVAGPSGTTRFLYDGDALVGEYDGSGNLLRRPITVNYRDTSENPLIVSDTAAVTIACVVQSVRP